MNNPWVVSWQTGNGEGTEVDCPSEKHAEQLAADVRKQGFSPTVSGPQGSTPVVGPPEPAGASPGASAAFAETTHTHAASDVTSTEEPVAIEKPTKRKKR